MPGERREFDLGDYVQVKDRIAKFYELYGNGRLVTSQVQLTREPDDKPRVLVEAKAYRNPDDTLPGVGWSWLELPGSTPYTRGSEVENAETSAWGRAIAALGILTDHSIASAQEVRDKQAPEPVSPRRPGSPPPAPVQTAPDGLIGMGAIQGTQDFELRERPEGGYTLPFRVKEGKSSVICVAEGPMALSLHTLRDSILNKRITVWGTYKPEAFRKGEAEVKFEVLHVERVRGEDFDVPAIIAKGQTELLPAELDDIFAAVPATSAGTP